jgi:tryptophanyl-tRNA synthetase
MERKRIVSGIRPTGDLHIGHYLGVLKNWVELQKEYQCFYFAADWHALTTEYRDPSVITQSTRDMVMTWLSVGLNPEESVLFRQSDIKTHAELFLLLSMITPLSWLERNPTYKELKEELKEKDLSNLGFLGYPVLQAADIVIYHADRVPIGEDQLPHLELTREIVRRFNFIYGEGTLREPKEILTEAARVLGIDGRKMSKSYGNAVFIYETEESLKGKVMQMFTDVKRMKRKDPGEPKDCNLYPLHEYFTDEGTREEIQAGCRSASLGCVDCKKILLANLIREFAPIWEKIDYYRGHASLVDDVLRQGAHRAREESDATMEKVRSVMKLKS